MIPLFFSPWKVLNRQKYLTIFKAWGLNQVLFPDWNYFVWSLAFHDTSVQDTNIDYQVQQERQILRFKLNSYWKGKVATTGMRSKSPIVKSMEKWKYFTIMIFFIFPTMQRLFLLFFPHPNYVKATAKNRFYTATKEIK